MAHYNPTPNPYINPPQPKPKKSRKWLWIMAGLVVMGGCTAAVAGGSEEAQQGFSDGYNAANPVDERPTAVEAPAPAEPEALPTNGTLRVGSEIAPGTYSATVTEDSWGGGYYERLTCLTGEIDCIAANEFLTEGTSYVTISPDDVAVKVQGIQLAPAE